MTRSFLVVASTGSITDAAERLGVTQSALSRRIQQYEQQLGAPLLARSRKGIELTEVGRIAFTQGQRLDTAFAQMKEEIALHQGLEAGRVRIGGGATAVSFLLPQAIAAFQQTHPQVLFQLKEAGSSEVAENVLNGHLELGIVTLPLQSRELQERLLIEDDIVLVAHHQHPLASQGTLKSGDLHHQSFVSFEGGTALRKLIDTAVRAAGVEMNSVMELRSIPSILRMVATTGHLAFVSRMALAGQSEVVEIPVKGLAISRQLAVIWRRHSSLSAAGNAFVTQLLAGRR